MAETLRERMDEAESRANKTVQGWTALTVTAGDAALLARLLRENEARQAAPTEWCEKCGIVPCAAHAAPEPPSAQDTCLWTRKESKGEVWWSNGHLGGSTMLHDTCPGCGNPVDVSR